MLKDSAMALLTAVLLLLPQAMVAENTAPVARPGQFITVEKRFGTSNVDGYNLYVPDSYTSASPGLPVIVFLQGGLAVGGKVDSVLNWELPRQLKRSTEISTELDQLRLNTFIYIMPHISSGQFYEHPDAMEQVIAEVASNYRIDETRIYLTGLSRGGHGTWGVASRLPARFAAIAPICGVAHGIANYEDLGGLPILTAHNIADESIDYGETSSTVARIEELSGKTFGRYHSISEFRPESAELIFITGEGDHKGHDAWTEVYNSPNFYRWLLRHKR